MELKEMIIDEEKGGIQFTQREVDWKMLKSANDFLKTVDIKGKNYVPVNERIKAFRYIYPRGQILTEILSLEEGVVTMKASAYDDEGHLLATGHAQEKEGSSFINKTSFIENCETSCIGRALGSLGLGLDEGFASYEEVANAKLQQGDKDTIGQAEWEQLKRMFSKDEIKAMYKELGISNGRQIPMEYYEKKKAEWNAKADEKMPEKEFY